MKKWQKYYVAVCFVSSFVFVQNYSDEFILLSLSIKSQIFFDENYLCRP